MLTNILLSKDFGNDMKAFSIALTSKYALSLRPSAIKILTYSDGTFAAYWGSKGERQTDEVGEVSKYFYVNSGEDARAVIDALNDFIANQPETTKISKPYIASAGELTVVFLAIEDTEAGKEEVDETANDEPRKDFWEDAVKKDEDELKVLPSSTREEVLRLKAERNANEEIVNRTEAAEESHYGGMN